jgi:hypothetical protein
MQNEGESRTMPKEKETKSFFALGCLIVTLISRLIRIIYLAEKHLFGLCPHIVL